MLTLTDEAALCRCVCAKVRLMTSGKVFSLFGRVVLYLLLAHDETKTDKNEEGTDILTVNSMIWDRAMDY